MPTRTTIGLVPNAANESAWAAHATSALQDAGYRRGGARSAVIELLADQSCALSANEIEDQLRARDRAAGRASIYRALDQLEQLGLVTRIELKQNTARYESVPLDHSEHHDHLVCEDCGDVIPFRDEELEKAIRKVSRRVKFEVGDHDLILRGHCGSCAAAN